MITSKQLAVLTKRNHSELMVMILKYHNVAHRSLKHLAEPDMDGDTPIMRMHMRFIRLLITQYPELKTPALAPLYRQPEDSDPDTFVAPFRGQSSCSYEHRVKFNGWFD